MLIILGRAALLFEFGKLRVVLFLPLVKGLLPRRLRLLALLYARLLVAAQRAAATSRKRNEDGSRVARTEHFLRDKA